MDTELGSDVIKATQTSLGKYVKRPPLSEKLLRKPPFRFLHDIVSTVHKTTGFFDGLFEEEELISENVKDRDSKIVFLNKVITVIGTTTGKSLAVKSSKIVAGQEPEKTNELLQCLALALDKNLSSDEAVKKYKKNLKQPVSKEIKSEITSKVTKKSNDSKKLSSRSNEKLTSNKKESITDNKSENVTNSESKTKKKDNGIAKHEIQSKKSQQPKTKNPVVLDRNKTKQAVGLKQDQNVSDTKKEEKRREELSKKQESELINDSLKSENPIAHEESNKKTVEDIDINNSEQEVQGNLNSNSYTIAENELNFSLSSQDLMEVAITGESIESAAGLQSDMQIQHQNVHDQIINETKLVKSNEPVLPQGDSIESVDRSEIEKSNSIDKVASISTRKTNTEAVRPPSVRPPSSRPGAPRLREKTDILISDNTENILLAKVNIIAENAQNEDEEDASIIVIEEQKSNGSSDKAKLQLSSNEHGHLVQQILDSQKEFSQVGRTEIEWQIGAQKIKETVNQEIEQLQFNIQALSRVANPLGKLLDHMQEDAEVMRQELQQWTNVYEEVSKDMRRQKTANEETLFPLQSRIKQFDADIQEKRDKIDDLKIMIHKNSARIEKLLMNVNVQ